jgi:hypothetical protein
MKAGLLASFYTQVNRLRSKHSISRPEIFTPAMKVHSESLSHAVTSSTARHICPNMKLAPSPGKEHIPPRWGDEVA